MNRKNLWLILCGLGLKVSLFSVTGFSQPVADLNSDDFQTNTLSALEDSGRNFLLVSQKNVSEQQNFQANTTDPETLSYRFQIGGDYTYVNLSTHGTPSFHGNLGGAQAIFEYRPRNCFYGGGKASWKQGSTHGAVGNRTLLYIDVQERLGYSIGFDQLDSLVTFFSGFGYRHIGQKFTHNNGTVLQFRYNEFYIPVGVLMDYEVNSWFTIGLNLTWMPQVYPTVSIVPLKGSRWILTNILTNCSAELPLDFTLTKDRRYHLILNPFYEHWEDGHSNAETSQGVKLGLPGNTYNFYGVDVNFTFCF